MTIWSLFSPRWEKPIAIGLSNKLMMYTVPPPGSGVLTAFILNVLDGLLGRSDDRPRTTAKDPLTYHRIAEAFKHAFAQRTKLADPLFEPEVLGVRRTTS